MIQPDGSSRDVTSLCKTIKLHVWCWNTQQRGRHVIIHQSWSVTWLVEVHLSEPIVKSKRRQRPLLEASRFINALLLSDFFGGCFKFLRTSQARLRWSVGRNRPPGLILPMCAPIQANTCRMLYLNLFLMHHLVSRASAVMQERMNQFLYFWLQKKLVLIHRGRWYMSDLILWYVVF